MDNLLDASSEARKRKGLLSLFRLGVCAFTLSVAFLILAGIGAYSIYAEGLTAQRNGQKALETFEQIILQHKLTEPINHTDVASTAVAVPAAVAVEQNAVSIDENDTAIGQPPVTGYNTSAPPNQATTEYTPIAKLQIEAIGLTISVLPQWSYELLDITINKFMGPEPNEPGNFIIIGHNYKSGAHFGNLHLLNAGDLIDFTDLSGRQVTYEVYEILIVKPNEIEKLATKAHRTVTMVTCTPDGESRLVIKSKEVGT